jgi:hypothetical protein
MTTPHEDARYILKKHIASGGLKVRVCSHVVVFLPLDKVPPSWRCGVRDYPPDPERVNVAILALAPAVRLDPLPVIRLVRLVVDHRVGA